MFVIKVFVKYLVQPKQHIRCFATETKAAPEDPIVTIKQGKLRGAVNNLLDGNIYYSFKGIPYAQPPIGDLRFQAPLPAKPWEGVRDALMHGAMCPQYQFFYDDADGRNDGDEDCLFLNVYTKSLNTSTKSPVMVFIHGGSYMYGSGNSDRYGPEFLLQHNVILVTLNYRLEALGFLCLEIPEAPGNAGIKDQVLALHWVKNNITTFGGDPNNITLFGHSVGASAVTLHMLSPTASGLFHKAIAQSGNALNDWALGLDAKNRAFRLGKYLGKETTDAKELLTFLKTVPVQKLTGVTFKTITQDEKVRGLPILFAPVVEKKFNGVTPFMTKNPIDYLVDGDLNKVPLMTGYTSGEGILIVADHLRKKRITNKKPSYFVPRLLNLSKEKMEDFGDRIKKFYVGKDDFSEKTIKAIINLQTDLHFTFHIHRFSAFYVKYAPIYMYKFDYDTDINYVKYITGLSEKGASHGDDMFYIFFNEFNQDYYEEQIEIRDIIFQITKYWVNFATTGNPMPDGKGVKWLPYTAASQDYIVLNENMKAERFPDKERVEFWNKLYAEAGLAMANKR